MAAICYLQRHYRTLRNEHAGKRGAPQPVETCLLRCEGRLGRVEVVVFPEGPSMTARFSHARNSLQTRGKYSQSTDERRMELVLTDLFMAAPVI